MKYQQPIYATRFASFMALVEYSLRNKRTSEAVTCPSQVIYEGTLPGAEIDNNF
jgi:hypothetical protein